MKRLAWGVALLAPYYAGFVNGVAAGRESSGARISSATLAVASALAIAAGVFAWYVSRRLASEP